MENENREWKEYKLGDICEKIGSGATPKGGKEAYFISGISLIRSQNVLDFQFSYDGLAFINEEQAEKLSNVIVEEKDILLNITGDSIARICQPPKEVLPARVNQHVAIIRPKKEIIENSFLKYYMLNTTFKNHMLNLGSSGGTRNALTKGMIENFIITAPSLPEQKRIAEILSSLDEKIELNNQSNKTLEEMAQAIFKQWFVDFEFPNENGEPYKSSGGEMEESELGLIPKGWRVVEIGEITEVCTGKTPSTAVKENYGSKYPFITIPDMHNQLFIVKTERYLSEIGNSCQYNKLIPAYSIQVSCIATVGLISINIEPSHTNQQINSVIPRNEYELYYFYETLKNIEEKLKAIGSTGSATLNVNKGQFEKINIIYAKDEVIREYHYIVKKNYLKILENSKEKEFLTQARDTLLPKLMSGEIPFSS